MLFMATDSEVALQSTPNLSVEGVEPERKVIRQWFSLPTVTFIGAHTGCSCGFPSVAGEQPVEYYDGLFEPSEDREKDLCSVRELLALISERLESSPMLELLPVWAGDEHEAPVGVIEMKRSAMTSKTFFFNEHFLHRVVK
jgi:hypothetical protein